MEKNAARMNQVANVLLLVRRYRSVLFRNRQQPFTEEKRHGCEVVRPASCLRSSIVRLGVRHQFSRAVPTAECGGGGPNRC
jgi:hypothetical protein